MESIFFKIGGITSKIQWNKSIPTYFDVPRFNKFKLNESNSHPDMCFFFTEIKTDIAKLKKNKKITNLLKNRIKREGKIDLNSPIINDKEVQSILLQYLDSKVFFLLTIKSDFVNLIDFTNLKYFLFFDSKWGGYYPEYSNYFPRHHVKANLPQIYSFFLPCFSSIMLHSAGIKLGNKAAMFFGVDGGGKTTLASLSDKMHVLNDDQVIVKKEKRIFVAHSTPFGPMSDGPCFAPIGGMFVLNQGNSFKLEKGNKLDLISILWKEHLNYTFILPKTLRMQAFEILCDACLSVPVYKMQFPKDYVDWDAIDKAMNV